ARARARETAMRAPMPAPGAPTAPPEPRTAAVDAIATVAAGRGRPRLVDLEGLGAIWWRDLARFRQQPVRLVGSVMRSLVWLVALGLGLRAAFRPVPGLDYTQFIFPGVI